MITFYSILQETEWKEVYKSLSLRFKDDRASHYEEIYTRLKDMNSRLNYQSTISIRFNYYENQVKVYGVKENQKEKYSLSLSSWSEWLNYYVGKDVLNSYTPNEIVAHCLWEMTFHGDSEEKVTAKRKFLLDKSELKGGYVIEKNICPFCNGRKIIYVDGNIEECQLCDLDGRIHILK